MMQTVLECKLLPKGIVSYCEESKAQYKCGEQYIK